MEIALYLIPIPIGNTSIDKVLPVYNREVILHIRHFIVEEIRSARRFLKQVDRNINIDELTFYPMGKHSDASQFSSFLNPLRQGESVGVISEAGCPAVADPGADIVAVAQQEGLRVIPLIGPSSILLAVMGSGFNGQSFAFNGYLPITPSERQKRLKQLENFSQTAQQTQLFIETPYRNMKMLRELLTTCHPNTQLCIAAGLTTDKEYIRTHTIKEWKKTSLPELSKIPTIFAIYAGKR